MKLANSLHCFWRVGAVLSHDTQKRRSPVMDRLGRISSRRIAVKAKERRMLWRGNCFFSCVYFFLEIPLRLFRLASSWILYCSSRLLIVSFLDC